MPSIESPLSGRVLAILVKPGDPVTPSMSLMLIESMKMEIPLEAELSGIVSQVLVAEGDEVREGQAVITLG
ncbi:MAG: acetyl-CoA carboxylase biotin carboxyl carrier protein subunit [Cytophagales bacterium]|nr:acetyl-CoA carboxylase biotin carboxyl carrier protein subunit [Rhizobacter sp.]